jgi:hypothetical protein
MTLIEQKALAHQRSRHSFVIGLNKSLMFRPIPQPLHQIVVVSHGLSPSISASVARAVRCMLDTS